MPFASNNGTKIYWDEQGAGPPILLIMGLGYPCLMWYRTRPVLANSYRTIALDNRGVGQSDVPPGRMTPPQFSMQPAFHVLTFTGFPWAG
jgi:3-oxoadipate enol-lactonase